MKPTHIAWLNSTSVATGCLVDVRRKALDIFYSVRYQDRLTSDDTVVMRITRYDKNQTRVSEELLKLKGTMRPFRDINGNRTETEKVSHAE